MSFATQALTTFRRRGQGFDTAERDIYRWSAKERRFDLLADDGMERFFADIHQRAAAARPPSATETRERLTASGRP